MNTHNQSHILFKSLLLKRNIHLFLFLNIIAKIPKCLVKYFIKNYIEYKFNSDLTPLSDFLTFKRQKKNLATTFSTIRNNDNKITYYGFAAPTFCDKATYDFEALIISTFKGTIYLDSNFSIDDDYFVAVIDSKKNRSQFLKKFIVNIINFYLLISKNEKRQLYPSDVKNFPMPAVNFELQKMFNDLCEKYTVERISHKIYLECLISECEKKIMMERAKIAGAQITLSRIDF